MALYTVRRLAADIMNVGENKIRIKPDDIQRAEDALTRTDVKALIKDGVIYKARFIGKRKQEKKKRRREAGRRGVVTATKDDWMVRVRSQRKYLRELFADGSVKKSDRRNIYMKIKSGIFKNKRTMLLYLKENSLVGEIKEKKPVQKVVKIAATNAAKKEKPKKAATVKIVEQKK